MREKNKKSKENYFYRSIYLFSREKMKQSNHSKIFMGQLMKAHHNINSALEVYKTLSALDKQKLYNTNIHLSLIDMELLQLLNGQDSLELLFDED
ncbi:MAG: hypothetical protein IJV17_00935 [Prevotella sp.]|nr:hypothetical protein [Prevotella sp.]